MPRPLLALSVLVAAALPARADDRPPVTAAVVYGTRADAPVPAFEPRQRVQQAAGREVAAVIVVRGVPADQLAPLASIAPEAEVIRALAALCRSDPRDRGAITASLPALPARF